MPLHGSPKPITDATGLAPALGVAACEALRLLISGQISDKAAFKLGLKWPNDLQWRNDTSPQHVPAKLAGILVETAPSPGLKHPVVVAGIGLNLRGAEECATTCGRRVQLTNTRIDYGAGESSPRRRVRLSFNDRDADSPVGDVI